jgi:phosphoribosylformylglycinamidine synthase
MPTYEALVEVQLRPGIADPQGATIERALPALGFSGVSGVRAGKAFRFTVDAPGPGEAERLVQDMCARLLANPVIEGSSVSLSPLPA